MKNQRVLLINPPPHPSIDVEYVSTQIPLNLCYIAASLGEEGASVKIIDFCVDKFNREKFLYILKSFDPSIVGFTSFTNSITSIEPISEIVKKHNKKIFTILGGVHVTAIPKQTMEESPSVDLGIIGEGELTIKDIFNALRKKGKASRILGTVERVGRKVVVNPSRPLIKDIDTIPFPARHLIDLDKYRKSHVGRGISRRFQRVMEIITSRGCPNNCIFCAGHVSYGRKLRFRSYENIVAEVEQLRKQYNINHLDIEDDSFTANKPLVTKLCSYLKRKNITWSCYTRVNLVDYSLLKLMKESGCTKVGFGVESGSQRILKLIKKNITIPQVLDAFRWANMLNIRFVEATFMLGSHPDETLEDIKMSERLIFKLMPDFLMLSITCPFPGTELYNILLKNKQISKEINWDYFTYINNKVPFERLNHFSAEELISIQNRILKKYYSSPKYILKQLSKIRSFGELKYFMRLGREFLSRFLTPGLRKSIE